MLIAESNINWLECVPNIVTRYPIVGLEQPDISFVICEVQVFATVFGRYKIVDNYFKGREEAKEFCQTRYLGGLLHIETKEEYNFLKNKFNQEERSGRFLFGHNKWNYHNYYGINYPDGKLINFL